MKTLTPLGWAAAAMAALALFASMATGLGFRWDPFNRSQARLERAEAAARHATADAAARRIEQAAEADQRLRLDAHHQQAVAVAQAATEARTQARTAHDADHPLDPDRAGRLGAYDRRLCDLAPALAGCAAPSGPSRGGDAALRPGDLAGTADDGRS